MKNILVVDDKRSFCDEVAEFLSRTKDYAVSKAYAEHEARKAISDRAFDLLILDLRLTDSRRANPEGYSLLDDVKVRSPRTMVIVMSAFPENRLEALNRGAFDFIDKTLNGMHQELAIKSRFALRLQDLNAAYVKQEVEVARKVGVDSRGYLLLNSPFLLAILSRSLPHLTENLPKGMDTDRAQFHRFTEAVSTRYVRAAPDAPGDGRIAEILHRLIVESSEMDTLLYLTQKRYRDHYRHQLLVGALGAFFLDLELPTGGTLRQRICAVSHLSEDETNRAWWVAALLHDHGYPLSHILMSVLQIGKIDRGLASGRDLHGVLDQMKTLYRSFKNVFSGELLSVCDNLGSMSAEDLVRVVIREIAQFASFKAPHGIVGRIDTKHVFDHGLIGAANIVSMIHEALGGRSATSLRYLGEQRWLGESLVAVALHNSVDLSGEVHFSRHPIAFLLRLCDELQEWDRKTFLRDDVEGDLLVETDHIKMGCFSYDPETNKYALTEGSRLSVIFEYQEPAVLDRTGWNLGLFEDSKRKALKTLRVDGSFLKRLSFEVSRLNVVGDVEASVA